MRIYIKDDCTGENQEFEVLGSGSSDHWLRNQATHFITGSDSRLKTADNGSSLNAAGCMYLHKVSKIHEFGGQVYEETGEKRCHIHAGEPYLSSCFNSYSPYRDIEDRGEMVVCRNKEITLRNSVTILRQME